MRLPVIVNTLQLETHRRRAVNFADRKFDALLSCRPRMIQFMIEYGTIWGTLCDKLFVDPQLPVSVHGRQLEPQDGSCRES